MFTTFSDGANLENINDREVIKENKKEIEKNENHSICYKYMRLFHHDLSCVKS